MDQYIGEIRMFAGNFPPKGWAFCNGDLLPIRNFTALYSILGVTYGGDGKNNFALPDLRGQAPMQQGHGPGLTPRSLGYAGGSPTVTLIQSEIPAHTHIPASQSATNGVADPSQAVWTKTTGRIGPAAYSASPNHAMNPMAIGVTGSSSPHNNMQPYLAIHFIIALEGDFPPRND